jgi:peptide/nickel transport system permease protein
MTAPTKSLWQRLDLSPSAYVGFVLVFLFLFLAAFGPLLAPYSPTEHNLEAMFLGPSSEHWLGTDHNGVDVLSALLAGARVALLISGTVVIICSITGVFLGTIAGYFGGKIDEFIMRVVDILLAFPGILLNIAVVALIATPGIGVMIIALCINGWVGYARVARGQVLRVREFEFVTAARAVGVGPWRIIRRHVIPNILSPIIVQATFGFGGVILVEATLSFLGIGPQLNYTWGMMLYEGTGWLWQTDRLALIPGLAIMTVVLGANLLGDGLRDRFDPKRRRKT